MRGAWKISYAGGGGRGARPKRFSGGDGVEFPRLTEAGLLIKVRVQPRAGRDAVAGRLGDALKVRLAAAPVEGEANRALVALLAKAFGVSRSAVVIVAGETAREKLVRVQGATLADWERVLPGVD